MMTKSYSVRRNSSSRVKRTLDRAVRMLPHARRGDDSTSRPLACFGSKATQQFAVQSVHVTDKLMEVDNARHRCRGTRIRGQAQVWLSISSTRLP